MIDRATKAGQGLMRIGKAVHTLLAHRTALRCTRLHRFRATPFSTHFSTQRGTTAESSGYFSWSQWPARVADPSLLPASQAGHGGSFRRPLLSSSKCNRPCSQRVYARNTCLQMAVASLSAIAASACRPSAETGPPVLAGTGPRRPGSMAEGAGVTAAMPVTIRRSWRGDAVHRSARPAQRRLRRGWRGLRSQWHRRPRPLAGAHGTILPSLGGWHVRHRQSHLWWFPSRPACSHIYINLMSHLSLTERGAADCNRLHTSRGAAGFLTRSLTWR
jgi:hypothetical protein